MDRYSLQKVMWEMPCQAAISVQWFECIPRQHRSDWRRCQTYSYHYRYDFTLLLLILVSPLFPNNTPFQVGTVLASQAMIESVTKLKSIKFTPPPHVYRHEEASLGPNEIIYTRSRPGASEITFTPPLDNADSQKFGCQDRQSLFSPAMQRLSRWRRNNSSPFLCSKANLRFLIIMKLFMLISLPSIPNI